jgi:hypothetical protein
MALSNSFKRTHKQKCVICRKVFYRASKRKGSYPPIGIGVRGSNCITCSPKCSKENARRLIKRKKKK